eukprot:TRINITY_DN17355_c0_g1_i1.p1 TRINITY_DN17355_c0_g1~~TRINITY_DN17355_c0_g1_i1.p1  ORF type:complete len:621 (+),score=98.83 TRINITY_DN17355_c0_g1_i1:28-1890(+)
MGGAGEIGRDRWSVERCGSRLSRGNDAGDRAEPLSEPLSEELRRLRRQVNTLEGRLDSAASADSPETASPGRMTRVSATPGHDDGVWFHTSSPSVSHTTGRPVALDPELRRLENESRYLAEDNRLLRSVNAELRADLEAATRVGADNTEALHAELDTLRGENARLAEVESGLRLKLQELSQADVGQRESLRELEREREHVTYLNHMQTQVSRDLESYKELYATAMNRCDELEAASVEHKAVSEDIRDQRGRLLEMLEATRAQAAGKADEAETLAQRLISLSASNAMLHQRVEAYEEEQREMETLRLRVRHLAAENEELTAAMAAAPRPRRRRSMSAKREEAKEKEQSLVMTQRFGFNSSSARDVCGTDKVERVGQNSPRGREPQRGPPGEADRSVSPTEALPRASSGKSVGKRRLSTGAQTSRAVTKAKDAGKRQQTPPSRTLERTFSSCSTPGRSERSGQQRKVLPFQPYRTRSQTPPLSDPVHGMSGAGISFGSCSKAQWYPNGIPQGVSGADTDCDEDDATAAAATLLADEPTTPALPPTHEAESKPASRPTSNPTRERPRTPLQRKLMPTPTVSRGSREARRPSPRGMSAGAHRRAENARNRPPLITPNNSLFRTR